MDQRPFVESTPNSAWPSGVRAQAAVPLFPGCDGLGLARGLPSPCSNARAPVESEARKAVVVIRTARAKSRRVTPISFVRGLMVVGVGIAAMVLSLLAV